jgi:hypothetical protein
MNLEAEDMLDRFIWRRVLPAVIILALALVAAIYLLR